MISECQCKVKKTPPQKNIYNMYDDDKGKNQSNNLVARLVCVRENVPLQPNSMIVIRYPPQGRGCPWLFMKPFNSRKLRLGEMLRMRS